MASHVVLVRHGQTEWTITGQHTGRSDIPLTDLGRQQALALKGMLDGYDFAEVFVSPFSRARETAERAGLAGMGSVEVDEDLAEWDYGVYESRRTRDIRQEIPMWSVWTHEIIDGESIAQLGARCDRMIARTEKVDGQVALLATATPYGCSGRDGWGCLRPQVPTWSWRRHRSRSSVGSARTGPSSIGTTAATSGRRSIRTRRRLS